MKNYAIKTQNGRTVNRWYDRHTRSWVVQLLDENGNQLGNADFSGTRYGAVITQNAWVRNQGGTFGSVPVLYHVTVRHWTHTIGQRPVCQQRKHFLIDGELSSHGAKRAATGLGMPRSLRANGQGFWSNKRSTAGLPFGEVLNYTEWSSYRDYKAEAARKRGEPVVRHWVENLDLDVQTTAAGGVR